MSSREYMEWQALYNIHPFGEERDDMRLAQLCALTFNMWRSKKQGAKKITDFMFDFEIPEKPEASKENNMFFYKWMRSVFKGREK